MDIICPVCMSAKIMEYWDQVWLGQGQKVKKCLECGLYFIYPRRDVDEQLSFDRNYTQYIAKREELVSSYSQDSFSAMVEDSIRERYEDIKEYFSGVRSLLEIGAERGGFLDLVSKNMNYIAGVDACPQYRDLLDKKGYKAYIYITDVPQTQAFERICLFSVLEHIIDPIPFLNQLKGMLDDKGMIVMEIPSADEPLLSLYDIDAFKSFYFQAMHHYVYSVESIRILLEKCGLKIRDIKYKQRYGLSNHLQWLKEKKPGGNKEFDTIFSQTAKYEYIRSLEQNKITDTLYITACKN